MTTDPTIAGIRQIALTVSNVTSATAFYRDVLGLTYLFSPGNDLAFLAAGDVRIMLTLGRDGDPTGHNSVLYFTVADVEAAYEAIVTRGATSERGPAMTARMEDHELWIAFVRDPDGNLVGLMEERR